MNKLELISALKNEANISKAEAAKVVQVFFDNMSDALVKGERVEIRGLCSFFVKNYKSYTGRNPKTGGKVQIKQKKLPFFKSGKELKERLDFSCGLLPGDHFFLHGSRAMLLSAIARTLGLSSCGPKGPETGKDNGLLR